MPKENPPHPDVATLDAGEREFERCPVAPTVFRNEPLRENAEGLFLLWGPKIQLESRVQLAQGKILMFQVN